MSVNTMRRARDDEPLANEKAEFMAMIKRWLAENEGRAGKSGDGFARRARDDGEEREPDNSAQVREYLQAAKKRMGSASFLELIESLDDEANGEGASDEPPLFSGRPRPGAMDAARLAMDRASRRLPTSAEFKSFAERYPHAANIVVGR
jgi:hypothetical protein